LQKDADGQASSGSRSVSRVRGTAPGFLAGDAVHALTSALLAALVIAAAVLRTRLSTGPFDLIALLLRTASVAFVVRALIALARCAARVARDGRADEHTLSWSHDGILWRAPEGERWLSRNDVLGFCVPEERVVRGATVALAPLLVIARPHDEIVYWSLPPYFAADAEILRARLARVFTRDARVSEALLAPPALAPEPRYQRAAQGSLEAGQVRVPEGSGYRLRAPYGVLLALVFVLDAVLGAGPLRARIWPTALLGVALALAALFGWFYWMRSRRAVRLGMAMLLTPEELLLRGKHGALSVPWTQLAGAEVTVKLAWSPLVGSYLVRVLWFATLDGARMPFDGSFLGVPPEVVAQLAEAYRAGALLDVPEDESRVSTPGDTPASDSQGSGGGGGISGSEGSTVMPSSATSPSREIEKRSADPALGRSNES
jgi:hypothetical protein